MGEILTTSTQIAQISNAELFNPTHINVAYFFSLIINSILAFLRYLADLILKLGEDLIFLKNIFWIIALMLAIFLIYISIKHYNIRRNEKEEYGELEERKVIEMSNKERNLRWERVLNYVDSINESDWRLGILEADNMLEEMLEVLGHHGESIGERLKTVEKSDFNTLDQAWEAHKIRNKIVHEGASFELTKRETLRVTVLYKEVFEEFKYI